MAAGSPANGFEEDHRILEVPDPFFRGAAKPTDQQRKINAEVTGGSDRAAGLRIAESGFGAST